MKFVDVFLAILGEVALIVGAIFLAFFFQGRITNDLILGLILIIGGSFCKIVVERE